MITEDYVSFETAKLLKEKGFDEKCQKAYMHNGQLLWAQIFMEGESFVDNKCIELVANYNNWITHAQGEYAYLCPTIQMAMKWILKKYNIFICILFLEESGGYGYTIENIIKKKYIATSKNSSYKEPEEACEVAIKYCLENLI